MANAGRPRSEKVCKLNITITEEDKDFLRQRAFERTSGNSIVTISDIIAEYVEADRGTRTKEWDARECLSAIADLIESFTENESGC